MEDLNGHGCGRSAGKIGWRTEKAGPTGNWKEYLMNRAAQLVIFPLASKSTKRGTACWLRGEAGRLHMAFLWTGKSFVGKTRTQLEQAGGSGECDAGGESALSGGNETSRCS
jgi:hypothetical protein